MSTSVNAPSHPNFSRRLADQTCDIIDKLPKSSSPNQQQSFLYSPSEISFCIDSPTLPRLDREPSDSTLCNSIIEGAYPSPLQQRTFLYSPSSESFGSTFSRWSSSTAVEGPSPLLTTHRISDWLPNETDFYADDEDYTAEWNVSPPNEQVEVETEPLVVRAEQDLPVIRDTDFQYYPEPTVVFSTLGVDGGSENGLKSRRRRVEKRHRDILSFRGFLRQVVMKLKRRTYR
ncbi:Nn.00g091830.m01.CDS01 [Neocucurbitaria sp. VM-36]